MMKNKLVLNPHGRNHFKFQPMQGRQIPEDEKEQIELVEKLYDDLLKDGVIIYERIKTGSYSIKSLELNDEYFIVVCIRNEFETYNNTIYEIPNKNDCIAIAKFIGKNINTTMKDYKKQILDAKKMVVKKEDTDERNQVGKNNQE